ncbi:MAG TPA: shikimate dehydrogenase [Bryobacteraceae bacterium]|nr:shikimate dehydrogenase [Bryobacteraceae bacterium]
MPALPRSLPRICVALGFSTAAQLARAAECEYKDGSAFLEFRLDYLQNPAAGLEVIRKFRASYPDAYVLATCRHKEASGYYKGEIEQQLALLQGAAQAGAAFVDLEIESAEQAKSALPGLRASTPLCLSYHNFQSTPTLAVVLRRLQRLPADAYKIATTARKYSDSLRLIEFARGKHSEPLIAMAMSETGLVTRVLTPSMGCVYTYAAPAGDAGTAPGQVPASVMHTLYRCEKLTKQSRVYGVVANPVAHSKSPLIHNRAFHSRRVDAVYLPFLVQPAQLADWMKFAAALPVAGFSVTIPHKQRILRYLDVVDSQARRIGAVNTVWRKAGKWRGTNTDTEGVVKPLSRHLRLAHASILIAGYGGAARAAAIALSDASANITITGRNLKTAQTLARAVKGEAASLQEASKGHYDALVHATPLGMHPEVDGCLFDGAIPADVVLDMVYNPRETVLLRRAKEQGLTVIPGIEMLLEQAAHQFEIWTGETAPRSVMRNALEGHG